MKNIFLAAVAVAGLGAGCVAEVDGEEFAESEDEMGPNKKLGNGCGDSPATASAQACVNYKASLGEVISLSTACAFQSRQFGETVLFSLTPDPGYVPSISFNSSPAATDDVHGGGCAGTTPTYVPDEATCNEGVVHSASGLRGVWNGTFCVLPHGGEGGGLEGGGR